jgi:hypothetical protein
MRLVDLSAASDPGASMVEAFSQPKEVRFPRFRAHYDAGPERKWQEDILARVCSLLTLREGWGGAKSSPIDHGAAMFALSVLQRVMSARTPKPQVVPLTSGGIQVEWHEKDIDLEFTVYAPYECSIWFEDHLTSTTKEAELDADFSELGAALATLSRR